MKNKDIKFVYFGTPEFAKIVLEGLIGKGYKPVLVVTAPDRPVGRKQELTPPPVKVLAEENKIPVLQPEKLGKETKNKLDKTKPDLFIVAAYGKMLTKEILDIPEHGSLNVHPSLLPKYRGPSPIQYSILEGDKETGTTIMLMDEKMDHGSIAAQEKIDINDTDTADVLSKKLAKHGAELLEKTIPGYTKGEIKPEEQNHARASYTHIITRANGKIDWNMPAEKIERQLRAFSPWPGIFTFLPFETVTEKANTAFGVKEEHGSKQKNIKRLKILSLSIDNASAKEESGSVISYNNSFAIATGRGLVVPGQVQLEGKNIQKASELLKGYPEILNIQLI